MRNRLWIVITVALLASGCMQGEVGTYAKGRRDAGLSENVMNNQQAESEMIYAEEETETITSQESGKVDYWIENIMKKPHIRGIFKSCVVYDIDHDGFDELITREEGCLDNGYVYYVYEFYEKDTNQPIYDIEDSGITFQAHVFDEGYAPALPFSLYYDETKQEYFYVGEDWWYIKTPHEDKVFVNRYNIKDREIQIEKIAYYGYDKKEDGTFFISEAFYGGLPVQILENYREEQVYQWLGVENYLSGYTLVSEDVLPVELWKSDDEFREELRQWAMDNPEYFVHMEDLPEKIEDEKEDENESEVYFAGYEEVATKFVPLYDLLFPGVPIEEIELETTAEETTPTEEP